VIVLDKGRSVGGRLATRRIDAATLDHGAQFFTVRDERFADVVHDWTSAGVVRVWCNGFSDDDGHPRHVGIGGMTSIAKHAAAGLDVRCNVLVFSVHGEPGRWSVVSDDGTRHDARTVLVTCPLPQSASLLHASGVETPTELATCDYERTVGLLTVIDGDRPVLAEPGGAQDPDRTFSFIGDNLAKGISSVPAVTFHAGPEWSRKHFDAPVEELEGLLVAAAEPHLNGRRIVSRQVKKWRFATPSTIWPERHWSDPSGTVVLAGDAFGGPKVEGAALSGLSAADALVSALA
jgi:predicted NAD/FAD-dependent oxidoreductase